MVVAAALRLERRVDGPVASVVDVALAKSSKMAKVSSSISFDDERRLGMRGDATVIPSTCFKLMVDTDRSSADEDRRLGMRGDCFCSSEMRRRGMDG